MIKGFHKSDQMITKLIHNDVIRNYPTTEIFGTNLGEKLLKHISYCNKNHEEFDNCGGYIP